ncbi:AraC family transcriptional regulator [Pseudoduganella namucuonensis]|uniref:AraC-type DNA-binding protein n=1 Tax=Pseudoduganella namucuonensis TaxID=1035707 RepID=A0A1I7K6U7_9BURK|nr:AraC family transcriptional regulator [Pseudoduganella namucuonensis]SFU93164.1 AraC-type DNA-binding protein [Pseudoduganella namucuonensis]
MSDRLASLLDHFSISARIFHSGTLCGINDLPGDGATGQLHLVRQGVVEVMHGDAAAARITEPSLLLYPLPMTHRFRTDPERGADFVCANLCFEGGPANPIAAALPAFICRPLTALQGAEPVLNLLFAEAFAHNCGREAMLDRLFEIVLIQVLRHLMEDGGVQVGMLAGMGHPRLRLALVAMHDKPAHDWSLEELAGHAGMSRSVFANSFRERVGCTPGVYLQRWRIGLAQRALLRGRPLKWIAIEVGYGSEAALSRAFKASCGMSPRQWCAARQGNAPLPAAM